MQNIPGFQEIFEEDNIASNPFKNLESVIQRRKYYKDQFGLKVCCIHFISIKYYDIIKSLIIHEPKTKEINV